MTPDIMTPTDMSLIERLGWLALQLFGALIYGLLLAGIIRKIMGRIQGRIGPPLWQPIYDLMKNLFMRTGTHHGIMFLMAPVLRVVGGFGMLAFGPVIVGIPALENFAFSGDVLILMYFFFFGQLGMALGAGEGGHPYSAIGVSRGLSQMTGFEAPFALAVIALAAQTGSFSLFDIVDAQQGGFTNWYLFQNPFAAVAAFLAFVAMGMYAPFNLVGAPQEIPVGPATEYNSVFLSMMMSGLAIMNIAKSVLFMNLFLGGAHGPVDFVVKTFLVYFWAVFVGAVFPRFRVEQSVRFLLGWPLGFGIAAVALVLITGAA